MDCLSPITISTRSKVLSPAFSEPLKYQVRCGQCSNCQSTLQKEWYYRAFQEYKSTIEDGGYMLMDCLTYSDKFVPRLWRFMPDLPKELNYMCFDYYDFRYFMCNLRDYLKRQGFNVSDTLRYFASTEYGTSEFGTHRPHIHILFYVTTPNLDNLTLSRAVAHVWKYGRTDGIPYKSKSYVDNYTVRGGLVSSQRVCKYVSKYVMKSSAYQTEIDKRVNEILYYYYEKKFTRVKLGNYKFTTDCYYCEPLEKVDYNSFESFLHSSTCKKLRSSLLRYLNQFHRQSLGFGARALSSFNVKDIIESNLLTLSDSSLIVMRIGLPTYYRRKLFYHVVEVNGLKSWQLNDDYNAKLYKCKRDNDKRKLLTEKLQLYNFEFKKSVDIDLMADYVLKYRWRDNHAIFDDELNILQKLDTPVVLYNYSTLSDYQKFHSSFITDTYLGCANTNYINSLRVSHIDAISFDDYVKLHSFENPDLEIILDDMRKRKFSLNQSIQRNYENIQRLNQVYKLLKS